MAKMNCICCNQDLQEVSKDLDNNTPYAGTAFKSYGHYGSTIFDPSDGRTFIELYVCDKCLKEKSNRVYTGIDPVTSQPKLKIWEPE